VATSHQPCSVIAMCARRARHDASGHQATWRSGAAPDDRPRNGKARELPLEARDIWATAHQRT
jgi:hypothetical protein